MISAIAALVLASTSTTHSTSTLTSNSPWWERVTVMVGDDGSTRSCRYETSLQPQAPTDCTVSGDNAATAKKASSGTKDQYTAITFERRFTPGMKPEAEVKAGETLLGGQVMALAIDARGAVKNCRVVATSGSVTPEYGCNEASSERFEASVSAAHVPAAARAGFMTVLVYGHSEHVV